ncbi:uncharacterized protein LOC112058451 [Bicyclus anynana]|uniref:Uncharacterized protein LOC112058451 n=1 Tax=Bicyclus anynana TaxID=110368 RepID=A0ABM3M7S8_BICAN|nr:uncharacterized protein LOC112058451 [Bicyclus anynana]
MLPFVLTMGHEIKLERLEDGPGLLPFKLGPMRLTTDHHILLQYVDLTDIQTNINLIETQLTNIKDKLDNDTYALYEFQIDHLATKLDKATSRLLTFEPNRSKRGLIDGLGSVIKSITGNLDYKDALKYENAIQVLKENQNKMISEQNRHISLNKELMNEHTSILTKLVNNQVQLNESMHVLLNSNKYRTYSLLKFAKFGQVLSIINDNLDSLLDEISRLENALAFCSESRTHHSMLSIDMINSTLVRIKTLYRRDQILDLDFRNYYDVVKSGSYFSGNRIVFIFKFPIVSPLTFFLYKLVVVPNKFNQVIIPPFPYLALTGNIHVYIEAECPKVETQFICEKEINHQLRSTPDCISNIIEGKPTDTCKKIIINLTRPAMEKLDDRHYAVVFSNPTRIRLTCERDELNTVSGSFLATIPHNCVLHTDEFTLANVNDRIRGHPLKIANFTVKPEEDPAIPLLNINSIDLKKLHEVQDRANSQEPIQIQETSILYHTTIPFYGLLLGALILTCILTSLSYYRRTRSKPKIETFHVYTEPKTSEDRQKQEASHEQLSATFPLNFKKYFYVSNSRHQGFSKKNIHQIKSMSWKYFFIHQRLFIRIKSEILLQAVNVSKMPFYAVAKGRVSGIFNSWPDCESQVKGYSGARYKKFDTITAAQEFIDTHGVNNAPKTKLSDTISSANLSTPIRKTYGPSHKRQFSTSQSYSDENGPSKAKKKYTKSKQNSDNDGFSDDSDDLNTIIVKQMDDIEKRLQSFQKGVDKIIQKGTKSERKAIMIEPPTNVRANKSSNNFETDSDGYIQVYTDGACSSNGRNSAKAGLGVYWGDGHPLNISAPVSGRATNNCGEIQAATQAIKQAIDNGVEKLAINTDSKFLINSVTKWMPGWKRKGWKLKSGEPVKNEKDFKDLDQIQDKIYIKWNYVEAHKGIHGNERADQLAKAGAAMYTK